MVSNRYGQVIWTTHAFERLSERRIPQSMAYVALTRPDSKVRGRKAQTWEFEKNIDERRVVVVAKQNYAQTWVVLSCWVDPPFPGSIDIKKKEAWKRYQRAGFWGKIWLTILKQLGIH